MQVVRIRQNGNSLAITLPRPYALELGWQLGDNLMVTIVDKCLLAAAIEHRPQPALRTPAHPTEAVNGATQG
jgi:antitoxin component of MazEF toxin-antitoxin module